MIKLTIDGKNVQAERGATVLDAAHNAGIDIPTLCYHKNLSPYGACRMCTVEIFKGNVSKLQASCAYPAEEGIAVKTNTERVLKGRKLMLEFLLARCPQDKHLQQMAKKMGLVKPRFSLRNDDCILCGLCVRVCHELAGASAIGFAGRGIERKVQMPFEKFPEACIGCGACTYVCPTGHIQMEFDARNRWRNTLASQDRLCRYARMKLVSQKVCPNSFQCQRCEVDQRMEDMFGTHPVFSIRPAEQKGARQVSEFVLMPDRLYSRGHVWVKHLNGKIRVGVDDFARRIVSRIDDIDIPAAISCKAAFGDTAWEFISGPRRARMLFPVEGRITDVNPDILEVPSLIGRDPYMRGWIFTMEVKDMPLQLSRLYRGWETDARDWLASESDRLHQYARAKTGTMISDGGVLLPDAFNKVSDEEWNYLTNEFFMAY